MIQYMVEDREGAARIVRTVVRDRFAGNVSKAAAQAGIAQATMYRLCNKPSSSIRLSTMEALEKVLTPSESEGFRRAVFSADSQADLDAYLEWLNKSLFDRRAPNWQVFQSIVRRLRKEAPTVANDWDRFFGHTYFSKERQALALLRILEPLLDAENALGVERRLDELSLEEFREIVRLGWEREKLLLQRASDSSRIQRGHRSGEARTGALNRLRMQMRHEVPPNGTPRESARLDPCPQSGSKRIVTTSPLGQLLAGQLLELWEQRRQLRASTTVHRSEG